jgi:hypothetical protein
LTDHLDFSDYLISTEARKLYEHLVEVGWLATSNLRGRAGGAFRELLRHRYVRISRHEEDGTEIIVPVSPQVIRQALHRSGEARIRQARELAAGLDSWLLPLGAAYERSDGEADGSGVEGMRLVIGRKRIQDLSHDLVESATTDFRIFLTGHYLDLVSYSGLLDQIETLRARRVRLRILHTKDLLEDRASAGALLAGLPEDSRTASHLPLWLLVSDETSALIPVESTGVANGLCIDLPGVVEALASLFEIYWNMTLEVAEQPGRGENHDEFLRKQLCLGQTDAAIAARMRVSERTVRRRVSVLMDGLGARTRFQAGFFLGRRRGV